MKKILAGIATAAITVSTVAATCNSQAAEATPAEDKTEETTNVASVTPSLCYAEQQGGEGFCVDRSICSGGCFHGDGTADRARPWYELNE